MSPTVYFPKTEKYQYNRTWKLDNIWELSKGIKPKQMLVSELWDSRYKTAWCWQHENEEINNDFFLHHMNRVLNSELTYPIILSEENLIFDGVHRLMKAKFLGLTYITYVQFQKDPISLELL